MSAPDWLHPFHQLVSELDYPLVVVTAAVNDERSGCLVGFHSQCSIDPPRWWIGISKKNHTYRVALRSSVLAVHLLSRAERERELASLFGEETGDQVDKFASLAWHPALEGVPLLDDLPNRFVGRVLGRVVLGDHTGFLLEPLEVDKGEDLDGGLGFQDVRDLEPGHEA